LRTKVGYAGWRFGSACRAFLAPLVAACVLATIIASAAVLLPTESAPARLPEAARVNRATVAEHAFGGAERPERDARQDHIPRAERQHISRGSGIDTGILGRALEVEVFGDGFGTTGLDASKWTATRGNDFADFAIDLVKAEADERGCRLRLRCGTIGTDDATVRFLGVASNAMLDLTGRKQLSLDFDWNDQSNGCYLTGGLYLCPTLTHANPGDEESWLRVEYVGVPPGKKARAAIWLKDKGRESWLYDEGWPKKQRAGRVIGKQHLAVTFNNGKWEVHEDGKMLCQRSG